MKLSAILEDDENVVMVPLVWVNKFYHRAYIRDGYEVIPIPGYQETEGYRAFKIIGKYTDDIPLIKQFSIPIWEDWKLTAKYAHRIEINNTTTGQQMFDHLDDDEKIETLKYVWSDTTFEHIKKYFQEHPDLQKRAKIQGFI